MVYTFRCQHCGGESDIDIPLSEFDSRVNGGVLEDSPCPYCSKGPLKKVFSLAYAIHIPEHMRSGPEGDAYTSTVAKMRRYKGLFGRKTFF